MNEVDEEDEEDEEGSSEDVVVGLAELEDVNRTSLSRHSRCSSHAQ